MADFKRGFTKGGMNLDVDERLLPAGNYREALNIRTGSSTEGNQGSLEPVEGTRLISNDEDGNGEIYGQFARVIGTCIDKSTSKGYHLVMNSTKTNAVQADSIFEFIPNQTTGGDVYRVFNDVWKISVPFTAPSTLEETNQTYIQLADGELDDLDIRENMRVLATDGAGHPLDDEAINQGSQDAFYVDYVDRATDRVYIKDKFNAFGAVAPLNAVEWQFVSKRILRFDSSTDIITGINAFDGMLFFTDNKNEPKKFNIKKCKLGSLSYHVDSINTYNPIFPAWLTTKGNFHTRLLVDNNKNAAGAFGSPYYNNKGQFLESHATVIRPNPEEHIKVRTTADSFVPTAASLGGPRVGVMTHPFAIHPSMQPGEQVTFLVAYLNEVGLCTDEYLSNQNPTEDSQYNLEALFTGSSGLGNPGNIIDRHMSFALAVDNVLVGGGGVYGRSAGSYGGVTINDNLSATQGGMAQQAAPSIGYHGYESNSNPWEDGISADWFLAPQTKGYSLSTEAFNTLKGSVLTEGLGHSPKVMFKDYWTILGAPNYVYSEEGIENNGEWPAVELAVNDQDGIISAGGWLANQQGLLGDTAEQGGYNSLGINYNYRLGALQFFDPLNPVDGINAPENVVNNLLQIQDDATIINYEGSTQAEATIGEGAYSGLILSAGAVYHRGGLFSKANIINGFDEATSAQNVSQYWGTGGAADRFHNGEMEVTANGFFVPTAPGQFVTPPHGFAIGDSLVLRGRGNTARGGRADGRLRTYKKDGSPHYTYPDAINPDGKMARSDYGAFGDINYPYSPATIDTAPDGVNPPTFGYPIMYQYNQLAQVSEVDDAQNYGSQLRPGSSEYHEGPWNQSTAGTPWQIGTSVHDGFMDTVKAKVVETKLISIDPNNESTWYDDGSADGATNDLRDRFIFLDKNLHGMGPNGDEVLFDGSGAYTDPDTGTQIPAGVFGDYDYGDGSSVGQGRYLTQYAITIEIVENNAKKIDDPTLRAGIDKYHYRLDENDNSVVPLGHGDYQKNAAMLQYGADVSNPPYAQENNISWFVKKSPYWNSDMGFGGVYQANGDIERYNITSTTEEASQWFNNKPKFYGPPLPQVWDVSATDALEDPGQNADVDTDLKENMLRFSYRYQYSDSEYSGFAPFTSVVWRTRNSNMVWPNYYISLLNEIKDLQLLDWAPKNLPEDVVAIELLVTKEDSPSIYAMKKYKFTDVEFLETANSDYRGLHTFGGATLGLTVDPDQLTRPFDAVPRKALAQDVTGNRIIYGNHVQDYNLDEGVDFYPEQMVDVPGTSYLDSREDIRVKLLASTYKYKSQQINSVSDGLGNELTFLEDPDANLETYGDNGQLNDNYGKPFDSLKSLRNYQVGIVYRDEFGRETPVLTNKEAIIKLGNEAARQSNRIKVEILNTHPYWAKSYKFFVKDLGQDYNTLPLDEAFHYTTAPDEGFGADSESANTMQTVTVLAFDSKHRNKVKEGDILVQKKVHRLNCAPDPALSNVSASWEPNNYDLKYEVEKVTSEPPSELVNAEGVTGQENTARFGGKFFVYLKTDQCLVTNNSQGSFTPGVPRSRGIFETYPRGFVDSDLYYEASQAYPIVLDDTTDAQWVKPDRLVSAFDYTPPEDVSDPYNLTGGSMVKHNLAGDTVFVEGTVLDSSGNGLIDFQDNPEDALLPTYTVSVETLAGKYNPNPELYSVVTVSQPVTLTIIEGSRLVLKLENVDPSRLGVGEHIFVEVVESVDNSSKILVKRHTHHSNHGLVNDTILPIVLPWYNCFSMGNGIEVSTVDNSFNGMRIAKGVKASTTFEDYRERLNDKELIFSGVINSYSSFNESNQFNLALGITKRFNPNNGSIQRLHARSGDLIVLCEDKILKVLSDKDALFNADGTTNLSATNRVLGQSIAFDGEYGISTNPESFASYGFRAYFADTKRGAVLRLSKDGLTPISDQGLESYFREQLSNVAISNLPLIGSFDEERMEYLISSKSLSVLYYGRTDTTTVAWDENQDAWSSFRTYVPSSPSYSLLNKFYSHQRGNTYEHVKTTGTDTKYCEFYGNNTSEADARVAVVYNESPGVVKDFNYASYEGTKSRIISNTLDDSLETNQNRAGWWLDDITTDLETSSAVNFLNKENKWFKYLTGGYMESIEGFVEDVASLQQSYGGGALTQDQANSLVGIGTPPATPEISSYEIASEYVGVLRAGSYDYDFQDMGVLSPSVYGSFSVPYYPVGYGGLYENRAITVCLVHPLMVSEQLREDFDVGGGSHTNLFHWHGSQLTEDNEPYIAWEQTVDGEVVNAESFKLTEAKLYLKENVTINEVNFYGHNVYGTEEIDSSPGLNIDFSSEGVLKVSAIYPEPGTGGGEMTMFSMSNQDDYVYLMNVTINESGIDYEVEIPLVVNIPGALIDPVDANYNFPTFNTSPWLNIL